MNETMPDFKLLQFSSVEEVVGALKMTNARAFAPVGPTCWSICAAGWLRQTP